MKDLIQAKLNKARSELKEWEEQRTILHAQIKLLEELLELGRTELLQSQSSEKPSPVATSAQAPRPFAKTSAPEPTSRAGKAMQYLHELGKPAKIGDIATAQGLNNDRRGKAKVTTAMGRYIEKGLVFVRLGEGYYGLKGRDNLDPSLTNLAELDDD